MRFCLAIVIYVLAALPTAAGDDDAYNLGVTRAEFFLKIEAQIPGLELPAMACGKPILVMYCNADLGSGLTLQVAENYGNMEHLRAFTYGAEGVLGDASATYRGEVDPATFGVWFSYCIAFVYGLELGYSVEEASDLVASAIEKAASEPVEMGFYEAAIELAPRAHYVVTFNSDDFRQCMVTANWFE